MSSLKDYKGYTEGTKYQKRLRYIDEYGNSRNRYVAFKDEDGVSLTWQTSDYTKGYQNLAKEGLYNFKVDFIFCIDHTKDTTIHISHVTPVLLYL